MAQLLGARLDGKDERSRNFRAPLAQDIHTVQHKHYGWILNQWVGSCTGHSAAQALNTRPYHKPRSPYKTDSDAMNIYSWATRFDIWDGWYDLTKGRDDTGSSVTAAGKATQHLGFINSYRWMFGYDEFLAGLMLNAVLVGTVWKRNMFNPDSKGFLDVSGPVDGGHAYLVLGYSRVYEYFTILNSWGIGWGRKGKARIKADDMRRLIEDDGEAVVYT